MRDHDDAVVTDIQRKDVREKGKKLVKYGDFPSLILKPNQKTNRKKSKKSFSVWGREIEF